MLIEADVRPRPAEALKVHMLKLRLEIEIENDAMREPEHVAAALEDVAGKVRDLQGLTWSQAGRKILDENGNSVGRWSVRPARRHS